MSAHGQPDTQEQARKLALSISAFVREARLTVKALRLYDTLGLLTPAARDPESGYRYYTHDQLHRARLIGLLRQLDMPLERIAPVLELEGRAAADAIRMYWREVERQAALFAHPSLAVPDVVHTYPSFTLESRLAVRWREDPAVTPAARSLA